MCCAEWMKRIIGYVSEASSGRMKILDRKEDHREDQKWKR